MKSSKLIEKVEKKDKQYRFFQILLLLFVIGGVIIALVVLNITGKQLNNQISNNKKQLEKLEQITINQEKDLEEQKADNKRQTEIIICLLAIHGNDQFITPEEQTKCEQKITENINQTENQDTAPNSQTSPSTPPQPQESQQPPENKSIIDIVMEFIRDLF